MGSSHLFRSQSHIERVETFLKNTPFMEVLTAVITFPLLPPPQFSCFLSISESDILFIQFCSLKLLIDGYLLFDWVIKETCKTTLDLNLKLNHVIIIY